MPFFFLLVDYWLLSAGGAGAVELVLFALSVGLAVVSEDDEGVASPAVAGGCAANEELLPGVTVSTAAELPAPPTPVMPRVGGPPKPRVSSPVSLAGVIVGGPL